MSSSAVDPIADGRELRRVAGLPRNEQIEAEHAEIKKKIIEKYTASEAKAVETEENQGSEMMGTQESIDELWKELYGGKEPLQLRMNSEVRELLEM